MDQQPVQSPQPAPAQTPVNNAPPTGGAKHSTLFLIATYVFFFIPYFSDAKNDPFVKFHMKQSLGLLIMWFLVTYIFNNVLGLWSLASLLQLGLTVLWIMAIVKAVQGKQELVPVVGQYFDKFLKI
jgi:uncharacterized membrane protein